MANHSTQPTATNFKGVLNSDAFRKNENDHWHNWKKQMETANRRGSTLIVVEIPANYDWKTAASKIDQLTMQLTTQHEDQ